VRIGICARAWRGQRVWPGEFAWAISLMDEAGRTETHLTETLRTLAGLPCRSKLNAVTSSAAAMTAFTGGIEKSRVWAQPDRVSA